ncbi:MAG: TIGR04282 family arsenosugar biosynthesis glycosyltransferase [Saprospiraceae bacterium]|nr:TIGR04282 family arsenosugar biosynthesis glycosyltransferase [Saprospiraceae bacterium]
MSSDGQPETALIIFVKHPQPGQVKTRLAATMGDAMAVSIYERLLHYTKEITDDYPGPRYVYYHGRLPEHDLWEGPHIVRHQQNGPDLGARMLNAFAEVLSVYDQALIIGSDCGELRTDHLNAARQSLAYADVVLGPSRDGGYYLLGLKQPLSILFEDIDWSTDGVLPTTLSRLLSGGLSFKLLETLADVDTEDDWNRLGWSEPAFEEE